MTPARNVHRIACIGEAMIELVADRDGTARLGVAGDTFNTAVYLARALRGTGRSVSYVTAVGQDPYSDRIVAAVEGNGIDASFIERRAGMMPGLYAIDTDAAGERSFSYWRSASAARTLFAEPCVVGLDRLDGFDLVFLSGITLAILSEPVRAALMEWIDRYRGRGGLVAYDSNHRPRLWPDADTARAANRAMWRRADIALPSVDDEMALFGDRDETAVLDRLRALGAVRGVLKRGAAGPISLSDRSVLATAGAPVKVVDSTAAGDSFDAGYLAALVSGATEAEAMQAGHDLAARVVGHRGAIIPE